MPSQSYTKLPYLLSSLFLLLFFYYYSVHTCFNYYGFINSFLTGKSPILLLLFKSFLAILDSFY